MIAQDRTRLNAVPFKFKVKFRDIQDKPAFSRALKFSFLRIFELFVAL